jgi:hypothetical protein
VVDYENMGERDSHDDVTPRPDPTRLTTQALLREIAALREFLETKIDGDKRVLETRLAGMDNATRLLEQAQLNRPKEIDDKVYQLREIMDVKFGGVNIQFGERDLAVQAALAAAKEAVGVANVSFTSQIAQQGELFKEAKNNLDRDISDLKKAVTTMQSESIGSSSLISKLLVGGGVLVAVYVAFRPAQAPQPVYIQQPVLTQAPPTIVSPAVVPVQPPPAK